MRWLTAVVLIVATLWGGYWVVGSRVIDRQARAWFETEQAAGRDARYESLSVSGFPNRFDVTVNGLHLAAPDGSVVWNAPFAQIFALTYKPWHLIAALSPTQTFTLPDQSVTLTSTYLQGSLVMTPDSGFGLNRIAVVGRDLTTASDAGWSVTAAEVDVGSRRVADDARSHQLGLRITDLAPGPALTAPLTAGTDLPGVIGLIEADATLHLTAPLDRFAAENPPQVTGLSVASVKIVWGGVILTGKGDLSAAPDGLAEGRIEWTLANWPKVPPALVALGLVKPEVEETVTRMFVVLAAQSPDPSTVTLPLVFSGGWASLGPLPLGPAPRLNGGFGL